MSDARGRLGRLGPVEPLGPPRVVDARSGSYPPPLEPCDAWSAPAMRRPETPPPRSLELVERANSLERLMNGEL